MPGALRSLVCPETHQPLSPSAEGREMVTADGARRYPLFEGRVPILLRDPAAAAAYASSSDRMSAEYAPESLAASRSAWRRFKARLNSDYRSPQSRAAFDRVFRDASGKELYVAVGGGPTRPHPAHVNLNIGPFPNVDVVGDAHELPYADGTVDAIYCEAVLEHLQRPAVAVAEMHRTLKPGGQVYAATPFMQAYHGYPHHYQNFTRQGHAELFRQAGFEVVEDGVHVGPMYTMVSLTATFITAYLPAGRYLAFAWGAVGALLRPFDKLLHRREDAHLLASTTYVVARKP